MLVKKDQAHEVAFSDACTVFEYDLGHKDLGIATAYINGRFPDSGVSYNEVCDEIYYVVSGSGVVHLSSGDFEVGAGDSLLIKRGEEFWVEGAELFVVIPTAPDWYPEQHKFVA